LELQPAEVLEEGKTGGLLLCITRAIHYTGHYVILDSGFHVILALIALKQKGVYTEALIRKCCYWPSLLIGTMATKSLMWLQLLRGIMMEFATTFGP
jgi:hypothetical protein